MKYKMTNNVEKVQSAAIVEAEQAEVAETATPNAANNETMSEEKLNDQIEVKDSEEVTVATAAAEEKVNEAENKAAETSNNDEKTSPVDTTNVSLNTENPEQIEMSPELTVTVLSFLNIGVKTKMRVLVSYQDAVRSGLKLAFVKGNRNVYNAQIDKLWKEISATAEKKFSRSCVVIKATQILELNATLPEDKRVVLLDFNGNVINLDTPEIESYYAVIDGQHRVVVCMEHPEVDLDLEILDYSGEIMELIKIFNSTDRNWTNNDLYQSNIDTGKVDGSLMRSTREMKDCIKCSDKVAQYLLTFKKDAVKKADCIKGKDNSGFTSSKGERGLNIARAIRYKFGNILIKVEFVDAIVGAYTNCEDGDAKPLGQLMVGYIADLSEPMKNTLIAKIKESDYGIVKETVKTGFSEYVKKHESDIHEHIKEVQAMIDAEVPAPDPSKSTYDDVKAGFPGEILLSRLEQSIERVAKDVVKLEDQENSLQDTITKLESKENPKETEKKKLVETKARLGKVRKSLESAKASLQELKDKRKNYNKVA